MQRKQGVEYINTYRAPLKTLLNFLDKTKRMDYTWGSKARQENLKNTVSEQEERGGIMGGFGFFDFEERCEQLNKLGDPLERLHGVIDWGKFRSILRKVR